MENKTNTVRVFDVSKCLAKITGASDLVDCLASEQAHLCGNSLAFGHGFFCKHPRRKEFIEIAEKLRSKLNSLPNVSQSDHQE